ncbi:MAG: hypothetical protein RRY99_16365 [Flavobacterium sp.]
MYIKTKCKINEKIEVTKHYTTRKSIEREERVNKTPEEMAKQNAWIRARDLRRTMELNFKGGDLHVTLTCSPDKRPTMDEALKVIRKFRDKLRGAYKKQKWILKYIITTELGERGAVHWHMVINNVSNDKTSTSKIIHELWVRGRPYMTLMDQDQEYKKLAEYMIKETSKRIAEGKTLEKLSYMCSRNLIRPVIETEKVRSSSWRKNPKAEKGWYVDEESLINKHNKFTGLPYQHYTLRKIAKRGGSCRNG